MTRMIGILAILYLTASSEASAQRVQNDGCARVLGPEWTSRYVISKDARHNAILFVRNGDNFKDWKEMVTIDDFSESSGLSPEKTLDKLETILEKKCPGTRQFAVLARDESSILFRWHSNACDNAPEDDDVGRVMVGRYSWYFLDYGERVHELAPETRAKWIKILSDASFDSVTSSFDPQWMSVDVDEVVPFAMDKVIAALKPAMESQNCNVSLADSSRIECKRPRENDSSKHKGFGGESVTAKLEAKGDQTRVSITTGLGFYGRLAKGNWSTPVYLEMMRNLQRTQP